MNSAVFGSSERIYKDKLAAAGDLNLFGIHTTPIQCLRRRDVIFLSLAQPKRTAETNLLSGKLKLRPVEWMTHNLAFPIRETCFGIKAFGFRFETTRTVHLTLISNIFRRMMNWGTLPFKKKGKCVCVTFFSTLYKTFVSTLSCVRQYLYRHCNLAYPITCSCLW